MASSPIGRRIVVIGVGGKSTLAETLSERLSVPCVELDALFWEPQWTEPPIERFRERVASATAGDAWVVAGNYSQAQDTFWPRAETAIWLDYSLPLTFRRIFMRSYRRWRNDELLWGTNHERFWSQLYSRDSLLLYLIRIHRRRRRRYEEAISDPRWSRIAFVRRRSPRETERWLTETVPPAAAVR